MIAGPQPPASATHRRYATCGEVLISKRPNRTQSSARRSSSPTACAIGRIFIERAYVVLASGERHNSMDAALPVPGAVESQTGMNRSGCRNSGAERTSAGEIPAVMTDSFDCARTVATRQRRTSDTLPRWSISRRSPADGRSGSTSTLPGAPASMVRKA
jgi:hypothetical protein